MDSQWRQQVVLAETRTTPVALHGGTQDSKHNGTTCRRVLPGKQGMEEEYHPCAQKWPKRSSKIGTREGHLGVRNAVRPSESSHTPPKEETARIFCAISQQREGPTQNRATLRQGLHRSWLVRVAPKHHRKGPEGDPSGCMAANLSGHMIETWTRRVSAQRKRGTANEHTMGDWQASSQEERSPRKLASLPKERPTQFSLLWPCELRLPST